jgi:hypothetical protein
VTANELMPFFYNYPDNTPLKIVVPYAVTGCSELSYTKDGSKVSYYVKMKEAINVDVNIDQPESGLSVIMNAAPFINAIRHVAQGKGLLQNM